MLSFKQFLYEVFHHGQVTLTGSGSEGERHAEKYITPHINNADATHVTKGHGDFAPGTELHVHGYHIDEKGKIQVHVSDTVGNKGHIPASRIYKPKQDYGYNDEHATKHVWNRMVGKGIAHNKKKMIQDIEDARTNINHPLHFSKAPHEGFLGKIKTDNHQESYYKELEIAVHTVHALATHPDFKQAVKQKHVAKVMGGQRGTVSETWKEHGASDRGGISKADMAIGPQGKETHGIKISLKKGGGSQLASPGPEEASAMHDHATRQMLEKHPSFKNHTPKQKDDIHKEIMGHIREMSTHMNAARGLAQRGPSASDELTHHMVQANHHLDTVHDNYPQLNHYLRHEATTGQGKFGKGTSYAAQHIVVGATKLRDAVVKNVDDMDHSGARPVITKGKHLGPNSPLTMRLRS